MDRILLCKHCKFSDGDNEFFLKHCFCWGTLLVKLEDHGQVKVHDNTIKKIPYFSCMYAHWDTTDSPVHRSKHTRNFHVM